MTPPVSIRAYLDAPLGRQRVVELEALAARFADRPLRDVVTDLRRELRAGISMEDALRLHILISSLYHQSGASIPLTEVLRVRVGRALARRGPTTHA